jgi:hypothetical protein
MDVPCPKCNSADLQKVSLACEEVLYRCDKHAQFHGILVGSGGPGVLIGASTTKGTRQTTLTAQSGGVGHVEFARILQRTCCPSKHSPFKSPSRRPLLKVGWPHASKIVYRVELFGPNHEIE